MALSGRASGSRAGLRESVLALSNTSEEGRVWAALLYAECLELACGRVVTFGGLNFAGLENRRSHKYMEDSSLEKPDTNFYIVSDLTSYCRNKNCNEFIA